MNQWVNEFDAISLPIFKRWCGIYIEVQHRYNYSGWETGVGALEAWGGGGSAAVFNQHVRIDPMI
jgi:hypothetical protein